MNQSNPTNTDTELLEKALKVFRTIVTRSGGFSDDNIGFHELLALIEAERDAAVAQARRELAEKLQNFLLGNDYEPAFSEDHESVYKRKLVHEAIDAALSATDDGGGYKAI